MNASTDPLETRLRALPAALVLTAADARAVSALQAFPTEPARRRLARRSFPIAGVAVALVGIVLINVVAAYFAPAYGRALASSSLGPVSTRLLAAFGLDDGDVTAVGDSVTSAGHTVRLVAGYADGLRTVLFIEVDGWGVRSYPKAEPPPGQYAPLMDSATMTDQFGHRYALASVGQTGYVTTYRPLVWPASSVGARLTVHISSLSAGWMYPPGEVPAAISGSWTLHATLFSSPLLRLPLPARVVVPEATYTFTTVEASRTTIVIGWKVGGPAVDAFNRTWKPGPTGPTAEYRRLARDYFKPQLFDAAGNAMALSVSGYTFTQGKPAVGEMTMFIPGPGRYRLQLGDALTDVSDQVWITVP